MHQATFELYRQLIFDTGGISLSKKKITLLRSRIRHRINTLNLKSPESYLHYIRNDTTGKELTHLIDSITTNYTFFFRENKHFELFETQITELLSKGHKRIRIWSAASSSGEEPYSLAMVVQSVLNKMAIKSEQVDIKILATDISTKYYEKQFKVFMLKNSSQKFHPRGVRNTSNQSKRTRGKNLRLLNH